MNVKRQRASRAKDEAIRWDRVDISKELLETKNKDNIRRLAGCLKVVSEDFKAIGRGLAKAAPRADDDPAEILGWLRKLGMTISRVDHVGKAIQNLRDPTGEYLNHVLSEAEKSAVAEVEQDVKMRTKYGW